MSQFNYVYVLRSVLAGNFYVGLTDDLKRRFREHQGGLVPSTKHRRPFALIYYEACRNRTEAVRREKYLKTAWGKRFLKCRLRDYLTG